MSENKLTIVPVKLLPTVRETTIPTSLHSITPSCIVKTATAEISFFNGVEDRIVQTIMKELHG